MGYLDEMGQELRKMLEGKIDEEPDKIIVWFKKKLLESYRNGQAAPKGSGQATTDRRPSKRQ